ncbi:unnamed protein product [Spirodela intermedia]|uniref:Uncharacterized protein n=1 Tax=Spirodela intermedia TaxID=51605 RepID=A0A7I8IJJ0_SPIIN|nr:unnamed protein product [Spirodela intermedia]CAA6658055.1 unnamed protein product [Spirodela intermedia]
MALRAEEWSSVELPYASRSPNPRERSSSCPSREALAGPAARASACSTMKALATGPTLEFSSTTSFLPENLQIV